MLMTDITRESHKDTLRRILLAGAVAIAAGLLYIPTLQSGFIWDDVNLILKPLSLGDNPYSFLFGGVTYYRPVLRLSNALDFSLWHLNPIGYHVTNIVLYMINSVLVFMVSHRLLKYKVRPSESIEEEGDWDSRISLLSLCAAIVFVVHPIHIESVAWISGRTDILTTLFFLLAFLSYLVYEREVKSEALVLCNLFFLFSLFSKENGIAFIGIVIIYGLVTRMPGKKMLLSIGSLTVVALIYFMMRKGFVLIEKLTTTPGTKKAFFALSFSITGFFKTLFMGIGYYIEKLIVPFNLSLIPRFPQNPAYVILFFLPIVICVFLYRTGRKIEFFLVTWIFIALSPSVLIMFSKVAAPIADRYLYLPSVGFCIVLALLLSDKKKEIIYTTFAVIIGIYSVIFLIRVQDWKDHTTIWAKTVQQNPYSITARINYGSALLRKGDIADAKKEFLLALKQKRASESEATIIFESLAHAEFKEENYRKAERYLLYAIKIKPRKAIIYNSLGLVYYKMARVSENDKERIDLLHKAISNYQKSSELSSNYMMPRYNIALCYVMLGNFERAIQHFDRVMEMDPQSKEAKNAARFIYLLTGPEKERVYELMKGDIG
jgi:tetratricopeptide (TPR) repeat protein